MQKIVNNSIIKLEEVSTTLEFIYDDFPEDVDVFEQIEDIIIKLEGIGEKITDAAEQVTLHEEEEE